MPPTLTQRLAAWIASVRYEDIPERVRGLARLQTANVLASMHAGHDLEACDAVRRAVMRWGKSGRATVVPTGERLPAHEAVLLNGAYAMALDYDDYLYMGHTGHSAVLASLALGEEEGLDARAMLTAQVVANEVGGRLGASAVLGPQNGQAWSFIHALEGAAVAASLYGLDAERTAHALGIALYQPPFTLWPGFMGPGSKVLTAAWPTVAGIQAAQLAREGLTGAPEILEHPRKGFYRFFTFEPLPDMLTGLGEAWLTDTLAFKPYPGCAYIDTTMDALFEAMARFEQQHGRPLDPAEVARVDVRASLLTVEMDNLSSEHRATEGRLSPIGINFAIPMNVAIGLLAGRHSGAELHESYLDAHRRTLRMLETLVELRHDWSMTVAVAQAFDEVLGDASALARLSPAALARVVAGYQRELGGGERANALDARALLAPPVRGRVLSLLRDRLGKLGRGTSRPTDLANADFTRFRMTFPSEVTIHTLGGAGASARRDVPRGAPGAGDREEVVRDKLLREASRVLGDAGAAALFEACVGETAPADLARAAVPTPLPAPPERPRVP